MFQSSDGEEGEIKKGSNLLILGGRAWEFASSTEKKIHFFVANGL